MVNGRSPSRSCSGASHGEQATFETRNYRTAFSPRTGTGGIIAALQHRIPIIAAMLHERLQRPEEEGFTFSVHINPAAIKSLRLETPGDGDELTCSV